MVDDLGAVLDEQASLEIRGVQSDENVDDDEDEGNEVCMHQEGARDGGVEANEVGEGGGVSFIVFYFIYHFII